MNCKQYDSCKKDFACPILGECVFGHKMIVEYHSDEPKQILHFSKNIGSVVGGVFIKIKRGELFNAEKNRLKKHNKNAQ